MPGARVFLDTNTLLYLHDRNDSAKAKVVREWFVALIDKQCAYLNLQVLNEATNAMLRKRWFETPQQVYSIIDSFAELGDAGIGWTEMGVARLLHVRLNYAWWDCLLLASALASGCTHFLSEDLNDGQVISISSAQSLTIISPFAHSPQQLLTQ
jgi:predicted nucleic acid-binding protein